MEAATIVVGYIVSEDQMYEIDRSGATVSSSKIEIFNAEEVKYSAGRRRGHINKFIMGMPIISVWEDVARLDTPRIEAKIAAAQKQVYSRLGKHFNNEQPGIYLIGQQP